MKKILFLLCIIIGANFTRAQEAKKRIDHKAYDGWKSVRFQKISKNGEWVSFEIQPQVGDGWLYIANPSKNSIDSLERGYDAKFIAGSSFVVFKKKPAYAIIRKLKLAKKKDDDLPKDSVGVFDLRKRTVIGWIPNVKTLEGKEKSPWFMTLHHKVKEVPSKKKKKKKTPEIKSEGTMLEILLPSSFTSIPSKKKNSPPEKYCYQHVTEIASSEKGNAFAFVRQLKSGKTDSAYVYHFSIAEGNIRRIHAMNGFCKGLSFDEAGTQLAFLSSTDTAKNKAYSLSYWKEGHSSTSVIVESSTTGMNPEWCVGEVGQITFSADGSKIYFGTRPKPEKEIKDTLTEDEKYRVDVWSWSDDRLQPEQLKSLENDKKKTWRAVYHLNSSKFVQLADENIEMIRPVNRGDGTIAMGISDAKYQREKSWTAPLGADFYLVDLQTGEKKLLLENHKFFASISPKGKYIAYYERKNDDWYVKNISTGTVTNLTEKITEEFFEDDNGNPAEEDATGLMGWSENDQHIYVYGKYDIWKINPEDPSRAICLTKNFGRETKTVLRNIPLDEKMVTINDAYLLLHSFNELTKQAGFYKLEANSKHPERLVESDHKYNFLAKAEESNKILFNRMSFLEFPDLRYSSIDFSDQKKLSVANPQQKDYYWGTVELVRWTSKKGRELQGLVYKPENFDSTKKYPLLVYYYEKYADDIHNYYSPRPSASIINPTEYAGNDYIVFIPDILYDEGSPGEDAYDCIVSGTNYMISLGYINKDRIGLQGQSWGGYQTAWLITQTNMYRAAMAGAPVSNMTSAYGGIRWGTGLSRMFQYEKTQSRLGVTLWEDRERYIKNSPVFFADKVETPLLIMHNDKDGAVPWYQGIEYFVALRRLDKPVWMLNYNDDDHNLTRRANQKDLSIRMRQFFDHYLQDKPMPVWMKEGLPALDKGKKTGYDLTD